ncbi:MAG: hypothetical protein M3R24_11395 [Chloroflexota bacterium]|nr:hypothetical protein [Chloroflexota bacterium]
MDTPPPDKAAPMASAPLKYLPDGSVDWGNMWDTFCVLARDGGPPHRPTTLYAQEDSVIDSPEYQFVVTELIRGIQAVCGLTAQAAGPGWVAVHTNSVAMAQWLAESIEQEHVQARADGANLLVPAGSHFMVKGEIKNVITAVAKTTHYWHTHVPAEVKRTLAVQAWIDQQVTRVRTWWSRRR